MERTVSMDWCIDPAVELHPTAEAVLHAYRADDAKTGLLGARGGEVREGFRRLREELRSLEPPAWPAGSGCPALESRNR
jgi:hypothetical protein